MRLSELDTSIQCEGPNVGRLTQFVRFAGCNMRCPGWPCDTQHAIEPKLFLAPGGSEKVSPKELFERVQANGVKGICLTGGEPFLQRTAELQEFVEMLSEAGYQIECFTNGSFVYPDWALRLIQFIMDWKLEGSGEAETNYQQRMQNALRLKRSDNIKFVVKDSADLEEAASEYLHLLSRGCIAQFWVGSAWDTIDVDSLIEFATSNKFPWKINVQIHKLLWDPEKRGV
jgi:7-carboxy-7-deazaguanine synthase